MVAKSRKIKRTHRKLTLEDVKNLSVQKIIFYDRVSSDWQEKFGKGIEVQDFKMKDWQEKNFPNAEVVGFFSDPAESAFSIPFKNRPTGRKLHQSALNFMDWYKKGKKPINDNKLVFNIIVTFKSDRFFRNVSDSEEIYKWFEYHNIICISATENKLLNHLKGIEKVMQNMIEYTNEAESETKSVRAIANFEHKMTNGDFGGGQLPYGFKWDKENKKIIEIQEQIEYYKYIFHLYFNENKGSTSIASILNSMNVPFVDNHRNKISKWKADNVLELLKNPILCGYLRYKKYIEEFNSEIGQVEFVKRQIVDMNYIRKNNNLKEYFPLEAWIKIQQKIQNKNRKTNSNNIVERNGENEEIYLLSGIVYCAYCGERLMPKPQGKYYKDGEQYIYYKHETSSCEESPKKSFNRKKIEPNILEKVFQFLDLNDDDFLKIEKIIEKELSVKQAKLNNSAIERLQHELVEIENAIKNMINEGKKLARKGDMKGLENYNEIKEGLENDKEDLIEELNKLENVKSEQSNVEISIENVKNIINDFKTTLISEGKEAKRLQKKLLRFLIKRIDYGKRMPLITYRYDFDGDLKEELDINFIEEELLDFGFKDAIEEISVGLERLVVNTEQEHWYNTIHQPEIIGLKILINYISKIK